MYRTLSFNRLKLIDLRKTELINFIFLPKSLQFLTMSRLQSQEDKNEQVSSQQNMRTTTRPTCLRCADVIAFCVADFGLEEWARFEANASDSQKVGDD